MTTAHCAGGSSFKVGFFVSAILLSAVAAQGDAARKPANGERQFVNFGVALTPPADWVEFPRGEGKTIVRWQLTAGNPPAPRAAVMVEGGKSTVGNAEATAQSMAKLWGGKVAKEMTELDGVKAYRISAPRPAQGLAPVEGIITIRDGYLYMILGGVSDDATCHEQVESVRKSWRWIPFGNPAENAEFRSEPETVGDAITVEIPSLMYFHDADNLKARGMLELGLYHLPAGRSQFLTNVYVRPGSVLPDTFDESCKRLADGMKVKLNLAEPIQWREGKGEPRRVLSQLCHKKVKEGETQVAYLWGVVELSDKNVALLTFTIDPLVKGYPEVAERIVNSVKALPKAN